MWLVKSARAGDPRLHAFLAADADAEASVALDDLLGGETDRVIRDTVRRGLRGSAFRAAQFDDVVGEVRLRLVQKLWSLRRDAGEAIENFAAYAAVVAEHTCYATLRARFPERSRLRNRVRYAVSHHPALSLDRTWDGEWRCSTRRVPRRPAPAGAARAFVEDPLSFVARAAIAVSLPLPQFLDGLLVRFDRGIELDQLTDAIATIYGITEKQPVSARPDDATVFDTVVDPSIGIADVLEQRETLLRVWREVVQLPPRQRAALLLNLRDPEGGAALHLLPATGVISGDEIAEALEMSPARLAALWDQLPMDDLSLAAVLNLTRQQVINLRKAARARLTRRVQRDAVHGGTA